MTTMKMTMKMTLATTMMTRTTRKKKNTPLASGKRIAVTQNPVLNKIKLRF
jgi:hypothetical protein